MKVLIGCEFSGRVRDAFLALGHDAMSCDILPTESPGPHHQGDVREILADGWDLAIMHPPCTYLCNSSIRWLYKGGRKANGPDLERWVNMIHAREFFYALYTAPIPRIAVENPIPHRYARLPAYTQQVQPWQFGDGEIKGTCWWLKNLPPLKPTEIVAGRTPRVHHMSPSADRGKERSLTPLGMARAIAAQWSIL